MVHAQEERVRHRNGPLLSLVYSILHMMDSISLTRYRSSDRDLPIHSGTSVVDVHR